MSFFDNNVQYVHISCKILVKKTSKLLKDYYEKNMLGTGAWLNFHAHTFAIWTYLTTVNQCSTISFSKKLYIMGKSFIEWGQKNNIMINHRHFSITEREFKILGLKGSS